MRTPHGEEEADLTILGMGKLGGRELNFSSDIDLIYFYSSDEGRPPGSPTAGRFAEGENFPPCLFRQAGRDDHQGHLPGDRRRFRFPRRPGASAGREERRSGPSLRSAEIYYESWGQSWERSAMLKARPVAGSTGTGRRVSADDRAVHLPEISRLQPDRRHDGHEEKDRRLPGQGTGGGDNIKLGRGGIREIEFFIQALQLVYAGKNPALRQKNSLQALNDLQECPASLRRRICVALSDAYRFLRTVEHRIQVVQERQTHSLPAGEEEMSGLWPAAAAIWTRTDLRAFRRPWKSTGSGFPPSTATCFSPATSASRRRLSPEIYFFFDPNADPDLIKDMLAERGFRRGRTRPTKTCCCCGTARHAPISPNARRRLLEKIAPLLLAGDHCLPRSGHGPGQPGTISPRRRSRLQFLCAAGGKPGDC